MCFVDLFMAMLLILNQPAVFKEFVHVLPFKVKNISTLSQMLWVQVLL